MGLFSNIDSWIDPKDIGSRILPYQPTYKIESDKEMTHNSACRAGLSTNYFRLSKLLEALTIARADGCYGKMLIRLAKVKLLIVDDWGFATLTDKERRIFLDILEDRYDISSTIISSQLPVENWLENIADPTVADAICDRLIHNAHRIRLTGDESMRKNYSSLKETQKQ